MNFKIFFNHCEVTPVPENPSIWGHFWSVNFKIFFNHGEVIHSCPWKSFNLGASLNCIFQDFLQPWWSHSLLSLKILQSGGIFELVITTFSSTMVKLFISSLSYEMHTVCNNVSILSYLRWVFHVAWIFVCLKNREKPRISGSKSPLKTPKVELKIKVATLNVPFQRYF